MRELIHTLHHGAVLAGLLSVGLSVHSDDALLTEGIQRAMSKAMVATSTPGVTTRVSVDSEGGEANGVSDVAVEWKAWLTIPGLDPLSVANTGADGALVLPAGFDEDYGPVTLFEVRDSLPRGTYGFHYRLLAPVTGVRHTGWTRIRSSWSRRHRRGCAASCAGGAASFCTQVGNPRGGWCASSSSPKRARSCQPRCPLSLKSAALRRSRSARPWTQTASSIGSAPRAPQGL